MDANRFDRSLRHLERNALLPVDQGRDRTVVVFRGLVWITQDDDARDVVLSEGESFTLDRPGRALLQALRDSRVLIVARDERQAEQSVAARAFAASWIAAASLLRWLRRRWTLGRVPRPRFDSR